MQTGDATIARGTVVSLSYAMSAEGEVLERSTAEEPMLYLHGAGAIVPGLERALEGKRVGDRLDLVLAPEDAFGEPDPERVQLVPRSAFPPELELEVGLQLGAEDESGEEVAVWITGIEGDEITVNGNHPLAGETLRFEVRVLEVRAASAEELEHGHPHGPGGAQHGSHDH